MAVDGQFPLVLRQPVADGGHGPQDRVLFLVGGQLLQASLAGQLDVDAHPVAEQPQLLHQLGRTAGDGLGVDIPIEAVGPPQQLQHPAHLLHGVIGVAQHSGAEKQPLDVIAPVKLDGQPRQLLRGKGGAGHVVGAAVDAVLAVVHTAVGHQHLEQGDAPPVRRKAVTNAEPHRAAQHPRLPASVGPAGGTGRVVFGGIGENAQLIHQIHMPASSDMVFSV